MRALLRLQLATPFQCNGKPGEYEILPIGKPSLRSEVSMIDVSKIEAEKIATRHAEGTRYTCRGFEGIVLEIRFGDHRSPFKLETTRICQDNGYQPRSFTEIVLWFDE